MRKFFLIFRMLIQSFTRRVIWLILLALGLSFTLVIYFWVYKGQLSLALHMTAYGQIMLTLVFIMVYRNRTTDFEILVE